METKWTADGEMVNYYGTVAGKHVIAQVYERDGQEPYEGEMRIVGWTLFDSEDEIVQVVSEKVTALNAQASSMRSELATLRSDVIAAKKERETLLTRLQSECAALRGIADFIDGKITHYVMQTYCYPYIITRESAKCQYDHKTQRLLMLHGNSKGDLQWRLSQYSDSSGCSYECIPCTSFEDAVIMWRIKMSGWLECAKDHQISTECIEEVRRNASDMLPIVEARAKAYADEQAAIKRAKLEAELAALK